MKKALSLILFSLFVLFLNAQDDSKSTNSNITKYASVSGEINFSGAKIITESGEEGGNILRFAPWFNLQMLTNWDSKNHGFFAGFTIRNIGFIYEKTNEDNITEKWKARTYNAGIPIGFKWGDMDGTFFYAGYEFEVPFNYKEKYFIGENKDRKFNVWFSDRVNTFTHSGFIGFNFKNGFNIKAKYYFTEFFNSDFNNASVQDPKDIRYPGNGLASNDPNYIAPREYLTVNVFYFALTWNMFRKPYYYYDYNRTEKADQMY